MTTLDKMLQGLANALGASLSTLTTTAKTVVGAINELKSNIDSHTSIIGSGTLDTTNKTIIPAINELKSTMIAYADNTASEQKSATSYSDAKANDWANATIVTINLKRGETLTFRLSSSRSSANLGYAYLKSGIVETLYATPNVTGNWEASDNYYASGTSNGSSSITVMAFANAATTFKLLAYDSTYSATYTYTYRVI